MKKEMIYRAKAFLIPELAKEMRVPELASAIAAVIAVEIIWEASIK